MLTPYNDLEFGVDEIANYFAAQKKAAAPAKAKAAAKN
jgi:hypothetical protein